MSKEERADAEKKYAAAYKEFEVKSREVQKQRRDAQQRYDDPFHVSSSQRQAPVSIAPASASRRHLL